MKLAKSLVVPYLKRFWLMLLSVVLVGAFGCGILIGLRNAFHSLEANIHVLLDECGYPDLYVEMNGEIEDSYLAYFPEDFNESMGIEKVEYRSTYVTTFTRNENSYSTRLIGFDDNSLLSQHVVEGSINGSDVRMDYYFAKANGFKVGDVLTAKMPDGASVEYRVGSLVVAPETSMVKADPYSISSSRDFAYVYVRKDSIDEHRTKASFNQILIDYKAGEEKTIDQSIDALKAYVKEKTGTEVTEEMVNQFKHMVGYATTYDDSEVIDNYRSAINAINLITIFAPAVFFIVVLIVTALFLFQIVKQCRKDIGVMRALGEKTYSISLVFLSLAFIVGLISWALGVGIGSIFTLLANEAYGSALKLFPQPFALYPLAMVISLGIIITVTLLTAYFASISISKIKPVEAMKALPPSNNETPLLTRTVFKDSPITLKVSISQTLRNARRFILSGICLLASGMLIFVALSIGESKTEILNQTFNTRINYDVQVYFDNMPSDSDITLLFDDDSNITDKTLIKYLPSEMVNKSNNKKTQALINGVKPDQKLLNVVDDYDHIITVPENGIVLSSYHAYLLDAKVGDIISCNDIDLEVKMISREFIYQVSYTSFDAYSPEYSRGSLLAKVNNVDEFFKKYKDTEHITYIAYTNVIYGEFNDRLAAFEISSKLLTAMAIVIGFMIVFNMMQTNLKEQKRTFATMRTLGYQRRSISSSNLVISIFQYVIATALAIPLGMLLSKALLKSISIPSQIHPFPETWVMYAFSALIVLVFLLISHFLVMSTMKKWNLPESVKERE